MKQERRPDHLLAWKKAVTGFVEHLELYDIITRRKKSAGKRISLDKFLKEEGMSYNQGNHIRRVRDYLSD